MTYSILFGYCEEKVTYGIYSPNKLNFYFYFLKKLISFMAFGTPLDNIKKKKKKTKLATLSKINKNYLSP